MKFQLTKEVLLSGLQTVLNIITPKATLPILSHILLETHGEGLRVIATDLDVGISCVIPVNIIEQGAITVPAKRFYEIIKELPFNDIVITVKKNNFIIIESESCLFKIMGLPKDEFPKLPEFKDKEVIKIQQDVLQEMLKLTSFAVSNDETRYVLNGILFKINKNNLTLVATDGKRLAIAEKKIQKDSEKEVSIIIPIKTIHELTRNLKNEGDLSLLLGENQIMFDVNGIIIISRLIEGEFPDYRQVIPPVSENKLTIERELFLLAVKRAALLSTPDYQAVKLELFKNKLVISKSTPDIGESREEISVEYKGKEIVIGFNPGYVVDVLKNLQSALIELELSDSEKPGVIRMSGYTYIVLPMRLG